MTLKATKKYIGNKYLLDYVSQYTVKVFKTELSVDAIKKLRKQRIKTPIF